MSKIPESISATPKIVPIHSKEGEKVVERYFPWSKPYIGINLEMKLRFHKGK